jgi:hypothetical protein
LRARRRCVWRRTLCARRRFGDYQFQCLLAACAGRTPGMPGETLPRHRAAATSGVTERGLAPAPNNWIAIETTSPILCAGCRPVVTLSGLEKDSIVIASRRRSVPLSSRPGFGKARRGPIRRGPTACDVDVPLAISRDQIHSIHYPAHLRLPPGDGQPEVLSQIESGALVSLRTGCVNAYQRQASATYWHAVAYRSGHFQGNPSEGWRHSYQRDVVGPEPVSLRRLCSDRPDRGCTGGSKAHPGRTKSRAGLRCGWNRKETMPCRRNSRSCHRSDLLP